MQTEAEFSSIIGAFQQEHLKNTKKNTLKGGLKGKEALLL